MKTHVGQLKKVMSCVPRAKANSVGTVKPEPIKTDVVALSAPPQKTNSVGTALPAKPTARAPPVKDASVGTNPLPIS